MERYSNRVVGEVTPEESSRPNLEKITGWLVDMQTGERLPRSEHSASAEAEKPKTERELERRREVRDEPQTIKRGGMVAVGEVLADHSGSSQSPVLGASGIRRVSRQKKMAREERKATHALHAPPSSGLTAAQAIQLGVVTGVCVGLLILLWLSVR